MCLQSPEYDLIRHMLSVNKWILNRALPHGMEELEEQVDDYTEGEYLNSCNDLQKLHKDISKTVEDYSRLVVNMEYQKRVALTIQCMKQTKSVVELRLTDLILNDLTIIHINMKRDEILYQAFIVNGHTLTNGWNFG